MENSQLRTEIAESEGFRFELSGVGEKPAKRAFHSDLHDSPIPRIPIVPALSLVVPEKWSLFGHKMSGMSTGLSQGTQTHDASQVFWFLSDTPVTEQDAPTLVTKHCEYGSQLNRL
jgi:hypothetical protein